MYLETIEISFIEPCFADSKKIRLKATLSRDITELLPYLNTVIKSAVYSRDSASLTFMKEFRMITLHPTWLTLAKALNTTDAYRVLDWVKQVINQTYDERENIAPSFELRRRPSVLEIFKWLPGETRNCKRCGELTCMAFAGKLWLGEQDIENCRLIFEARHAESYQALCALLRALGY